MNRAIVADGPVEGLENVMLPLVSLGVNVVFGGLSWVILTDDHRAPAKCAAEEIPSVTKLAGLLRMSQGIVWLMLGNKDNAIASFNRAIEIGPENPTGYALRALLRLSDASRDDLDLALIDISRAIELHPAATFSYRVRACLHFRLGNPPAAMADCDYVVKLDPTDDTSYAQRGGLHGMMGHYDAAIADCTEAIRLNPENAEAFYYRGIARALQSDWEGARADGYEGLRLCPTDHRNYELLIEVFTQTREYDKAIDMCTKAHAKYPKTGRYLTLRGQAYASMERWEEAIADLSEVIRGDTMNISALLVRAQCHLHRGDYDEAIADCTMVTGFRDNEKARIVRARVCSWHLGGFFEWRGVV
jgi:tetratricopeptide (TPR) repeat protein